MPNSLDLTRLLPPRYRDKTLDTLLKNVFNRHLSKSDTVPIFGYVGNTSNLQSGEVAIVERDLERQLNQLTPLIYAEHATEKKIFSWPDLVQKLVLQGVNYESLRDIFTTKSYNLVPPIDLDKFSNYNEYFWIGQWILTAPSLPWSELGIPLATELSPTFTLTGNVTYEPEYYVIERGSLDVSGYPVQIAPNLVGWSDWSLTNLWVHREDAQSFLNAHGGLINFSQLVQATRPIIEYGKRVALNTYQNSQGEPTDTGTYVVPTKVRINQIPLFDLYDAEGAHLGATSGIFYFSESAEYPVDAALQRRIVRDENDDYVFEHSLVAEDGSLYFYKHFDAATGSGHQLRTIWRQGPDAYPRYVKYDVSGTLINNDKFVNYRNYYWTAVDTAGMPSYNTTGLPEYYVIESTGTSGWATDNHWVHVSTLKRSELASYVQAERPIIEFNALLEPELYNGKTSYGQLPVFKHYRFDDVTDTYVQIPSGTIPTEANLNDAYTQRHLLVRLEDLPNVAVAARETPEILANTFEFAGSTYLQGLSTGMFVPSRDGVTYGYRATAVDAPSASKGALGVVSVGSTCTPEVITFTWNTSTFIFDVRGTVTGVAAGANLGTNYTVSGVTVNITPGSSPLVNGDTFKLEIKSVIYEKTNLYVNLDGAYRTLTAPDKIINEQQANLVVEANLSDRDGVWEVPPQLLWNPQSETRSTLKQGDLYYHFTKIIKAQPLLVGSEAGKNNWRLLTTRDVGLGGTIKQYDGDVALLISMLLQDGITIPALINFARESYDRLGTAAHTFVERYMPEMLVRGEFTIPTSGDTIDPVLVQKFKSYFASESSVATASTSVIDDTLATPFYDTTSSISNMVLTLPYLGLGTKALPHKKFDLELSMNVLVHHDGHVRQLPSSSVQALKDLAVKTFERSPGQFTAGSVGVAYPTTPYKGQFWFKTTTVELFYYNVVSDTGERPTDAATGAYTYDRAAGTIHQYNGSAWVAVGGPSAVNLPWTLVDLGLIEQNLLLALETELYNHCPTLAPRLNTSVLEADADYDDYLQQELESFGVRYGVADVYSSNYSPTNSLTWNYSSVTAIGASSPLATWQDIYTEVYGTPRPDLEPWIPAGYANEAAMISDLIVGGAIPMGTTEWTVSLWPAAASYLRSRYVLNSKPNRLSVNTATGALLGPHGFGSAEELVTTIPASASDAFTFGDNGPVERFWRKTLNFLYSKQKIYYKLDPREYVSSTWGIKQTQLGEYTFNAMLKQKDRASMSQFHGDVLSELVTADWIDVDLVAPPSSTVVYTIQCVNRIDGVFKVTSSASSSVAFFTGTHYANSIIDVDLFELSRGFITGDTFKITVTNAGVITVEVLPVEYLRVDGFNQLFVQYNRLYGQDLSVALNKSLFTGWQVKLGYRFSGLINTEQLEFKSDEVIDESAFNVYLKENKFYNSSWINAVRVQLAQRGSTERVGGYNVPREGPGGTPGEDFVFRIDTYNPARPQLTWNLVDTTGEPTEFIALDGTRTSFPWKKYPVSDTVVTHAAPFLITGIQNLVNFIYGYSAYLDAAGWKFNTETTPLDPDTNRPINYQLLVEKLIVQLFSNAEAGSAFTVNPFSRRANFATPRGTVSNLNDLLGIEQETVCSILDSQAKRITTSNLRVFRQDDVTEIISDVPVYTMHLLTSEYEHVALFENYSVDSLLVYDPFLGQKVEQLFIKGQRQAEFTGRIDFGGHFLLGDEMKRNIESSIQGISKLYDSTSVSDSLPETERARALLGFQKKSYFEDRGSPDMTEFRFWQGMISNKGTNFAIEAYTNSTKYNSAKLDEYWAYKVAEYGDARPKNKPELKVEPEDATTELSNYLFVEEDDLATVRDQENSDGYDVPDYDAGPYDGLLAFNPATFYEMPFDPQGTLLIKPNDEQRWFRYVDLKQFQYFDAEPFVYFNLTPTSLEDLYQITDELGRPVRADIFELIDTTLVSATLGGYDDASYEELPYDYSSNNPTVYRETGDYIIGTEPPEYTEPKFRRINHSTIQILDETILGRLLTVVGYRPAAAKYSPVQLYNYVSNTVVKDDVIWWDPARGVHHPEAIASIDYTATSDPARYNNTIINARNMNREKLKPWGENEVGKIWWNQKKVFWKPYSDAKLIPDMNERLAGWGSLSDLSTIDVYEWVKSSTPPESYDGEVALSRTVKRDRTWQQRTVAWRHNSSGYGKQFKKYQPTQIKVVTGSINYIVLKTGSLEEHGLTKDTKFAGAYYNDASKYDQNLVAVFGEGKIISSTQDYVFGSSAGFDDGPIWTSNSYFSFRAEAVKSGLNFRAGKNLGQYRLSHDIDLTVNKTYIRLTHVISNDSQAIELKDSPVRAGTDQPYYFDQLGIKIVLTPYYGHLDAWPSLGVPTQEQRKVAVRQSLGLNTHQIYLRAKADIESNVPFSYNDTLWTIFPAPSFSDPGALTGWVSWEDPAVVPTDLTTSLYSPVVGAWEEVGDKLAIVKDAITSHAGDPEAYAPYRSIWSYWSEDAPALRTVRYVTSSVYTEDQLFRDQLTFATLSSDEVLQRVKVYVNETLLPASRWTVGVNSSGFPYLQITGVNPGDTIKTKEEPATPDFGFDPDVEDNPLKLRQYKHETPYVLDVRRDSVSNLTQKNYYFWVKNKLTPARDKNLPIKLIAELLRSHDGMYSVPQVVKFYNQLDGRPNRYSLLSVKGMSLYVRRKGAYKLRLGKNPTLRDSDRDLELKNTHVEWKLLRPLSPTRLPKQLWDLLTDALAGENQLNQTLPSSALELYDARNTTEQRYGFTSAQILVDPQIARDTLKFTVLNTRVDKYVNGVLVPDYIAYTGFDVNDLDAYLSTPTEIRSFMADLWRFAKPKQLNEIFFAVLEDAITKNLELTDFFKTSFVSLSEVRDLEQS